MSSEFVFKYGRLTDYPFDRLPKGYVVKLSMNPYNGKVYVDCEKNESSTVIALELMREIVAACSRFERMGSDDPLHDLLSVCNGFNWDSLAGSGCDVLRAFEGRRDENQEDEDSSSADVVKVAS